MLPVLYVFLAIVGIVHCYAPRNTVAVVGKPMVINCKANSNETSILWTFQKLGGIGEDLITKRTMTHKLGFTVNNTENDQFSLVKTNTQLNDSGTYKCLSLRNEQLSDILTAQVTVLLSDPECGTNASNSDSTAVENEYLSLWCQINYTGSMVPIIKWSRSDGRNSTVYNSISTFELYKSVISITTELVTADDNDILRECKIYFDRPPFAAPQATVTQASNVPDYEHRWSYVSKVLFASRNISIRPMKSLYNSEDILTCSAEGNPLPTYEWAELPEANYIIKGPNITLINKMATTQEFVYNCTARNFVSGKMTSVSKTVTVNVVAMNQSDSEPSKTLATIIMTGCTTAGAFAAFLFICWFVYRLQKKKQQLKKAEGSESSKSAQDYDVIDEHALQNPIDEDCTNIDEHEATTTINNGSEMVQQDQRPYTTLTANRSLPVPSFYTPLQHGEQQQHAEQGANN